MRWLLLHLSQLRSASSIVCLIPFLTILSQSILNSVEGQETSATKWIVQMDRKTKHHTNQVSFDEIVTYGRKFDISSRDLIVLLHIQKTGGTAFEKHLVGDLSIDRPCICNFERRRCNCPRPNDNTSVKKTFADSTWLMSRFSTGWLCGLHPDWSSLNDCLSTLKDLFFATLLRNPIERFVSEYRHVQRGATWKLSKSRCRAYNTQLCYNGENWSNVTLIDFVNCDSNMAINRQTRMLADLSHKLCPANMRIIHSPTYGRALLSSAMRNLEQMAYFGLCEEQRASQVVFERTFGLKFTDSFDQSEDNKTRIMIDALPPDIRQSIAEKNNLDMELYQFASHLFWDRLKKLNGTDM